MSEERIGGLIADLERQPGAYAKSFASQAPPSYVQMGVRYRLKRAFEEGIVFGVKWGIASLIVLGLWGASGAYFWSKLETSLQQALHGQQAFQWLAANEKPLVALVEAKKAEQAKETPAK